MCCNLNCFMAYNLICKELLIRVENNQGSHQGFFFQIPGHILGTGGVSLNVKLALCQLQQLQVSREFSFEFISKEIFENFDI